MNCELRTMNCELRTDIAQQCPGKPLTKIFFYLLASLLIGLLIAPLIYQVIQGLPASHCGKVSEFLFFLQQMPFHRYVSRSVQVTALLLLWPTIAWLRIQSLSELSLYKNRNARADLLCGIVVALVPLWLLETFFVWNGWYLFNAAIAFSSLFKLLATAMFVSLFEEFFFRGLLLGLSRRFLSDRVAIFFTAFLFAGVHFLNMPHAAKESVHWWSGLAICANVAQGLPATPLLLGAFASLLALGIILAWVTLRTGSLWLAIGLHAAWIFGQQSFNHVAHYAITPPNAFLPWIGVPQIYGMVPVGLLTFLPLMVTVLLLKRWLTRSSTALL